jgi:hypothetical protein
MYGFEDGSDLGSARAAQVGDCGWVHAYQESIHQRYLSGKDGYISKITN